MVFLFVFTVIVLGLCAQSVWKRVGDEPVAVRPWRADPGASTAEGLLAAQLAAGHITDRQYVRAMEQIAAGGG